MIINEQLVTYLDRRKQYKYPFLLLGFYLTCLLATVCLANRMTSIGPMLEPGGIFVFCFTFCICDVVGEVYGYAYPRLFIWIGLVAELIFAFVVTLVSHMPFPVYFNDAKAYEIVFDPTIRFVFSSLVALLVGEFANIYLLAKWKIALRGKYFMVRSFISTAFGQALLTIVVDLLNYTGKLSIENLINLMVSGYLWKIVFAILLIFPSWLLVRYLKKVEDINYFDIHTNFNPFTLQLNEQNLNTAEKLSYSKNIGVT